MKTVLAAFLLAGLTLTSCSSDDNGSSTPASIVGKWNPLRTEIKSGSNPAQVQNYTGDEPGCNKDYYEFEADGDLRDVIYFKNASDVCTEDEGEVSTWAKNNNTLTITDGEFAGVYEIKVLSNSDLQIATTSSLGGIQTTVTLFFKKAAN